MNQQLPVPNWDNFTPEQKQLYQVWIKSLEDAEAASMELVKSFSEKEIAPEVTIGSNSIAVAENVDFSSIKLSVKFPRDIPCWAIQKICQARCLFKPNPQQCSDDCLEQHNCT